MDIYMALKVVGLAVAGFGIVLSTIFGIMSWIECGDEISGGVRDAFVAVALLGGFICFLARFGKFVEMAY